MQSTESSVCSIVTAFTSGLDTFRKLRQRREKQTKSSTGGRRPHAAGPKKAHDYTDKTGEQSKLSKSLQRGSADVYNVYAQHAQHDGLGYAAGDAVAHASLAQTLLKLNSGLVGIISTLLTQGRHDMPLDYTSLTSLSDASRAEAIDALENLHSRLSRPQPVVQSTLKFNPHTGRGRQANSDNKPGKEMRTTERSPELPPGIAKVTVNTSQTQLVWARPVKKRKGSTNSARTSKTNRSTSASPSQQPSVSTTPLPAYSPPHEAYPFPSLLYQPALPGDQVSPHLQATQTDCLPADCQSPAMTARRRDKVTPSFYSFATDSTKLGEIPMRKWTVPFNQAEADRLNALALATGWKPPPPPATLEQQQQQKKKKKNNAKSRFMRLFGKGRGANGQQH